MILWTTRQTSLGLGSDAHMHQGVTDGVTQICRAIGLITNQTPASGTQSQCERLDRLVYLTDQTTGATPTVQVEGEFVQFNADGGFDIDWLINDGAADIFHCFMFESALSLKLVSEEVPSSGSSTFTSVGFQALALFITSGAIGESGAPVSYNEARPFGAFHGIGLSNVTKNYVVHGRNVGGLATSYSKGGASSLLSYLDHVANLPDHLTLNPVLNSGGISAISATGFTASHSAGPMTPLIHALALRSMSVELISITCPASAGVVTASIPFHADAVFFFSRGGASTGDYLGVSIGACDRWEATQGGTWIGGSHGLNPTRFARATYSDATIKAYTPANPGSGSTLTLSATAAITATGVDMTFATTPGTSTVIYGLAVRSLQAAVPTVPATPTAGPSTPCCGTEPSPSGSVSGEVPEPYGPDWTPACAGGAVIATTPLLTLTEAWDY